MTIRSADPQALPVVEHGFLTDRDGHDLSVLVDGVRLARRLAGTKALSGLCEGELAPGPDLDDGELQAYVRRWVRGYWHPVDTCRMEPASDADAVVDRDGCVHGFDNLFVADASVMPTIPVPTFTCPCWQSRNGSPRVSGAAEPSFGAGAGLVGGAGAAGGRACQHRRPGPSTLGVAGERGSGREGSRRSSPGGRGRSWSHFRPGITLPSIGLARRRTQDLVVCC